MLRSRPRAFTLLELLLVLFILAATAAGAASLVGNADEQLRFEETRSRLRRVRAAILGQADAAPGERAPAGFLADMGRYPTSLRELLEPASPAFAYDAATGVGYGWRGPYLHALPGLGSSARRFPDGWGNAALPSDAAGNDGWVFPGVDAQGDLVVRSRGRDGKEGGGSSPFDADDPQGPLIQRAEGHVNLQGWQVQVRLQNGGPAQSETLRLRLNLPEAGALTRVESLSQSALALPTGETLVTFTWAASERWVTWGERTLEVVRESPAGSGTFVRLGSGAPQRVRLQPRGLRPAALPSPWSVQ